MKGFPVLEHSDSEEDFEEVLDAVVGTSVKVQEQSLAGMGDKDGVWKTGLLVIGLYPFVLRL